MSNEILMEKLKAVFMNIYDLECSNLSKSLSILESSYSRDSIEKKNKNTLLFFVLLYQNLFANEIFTEESKTVFTGDQKLGKRQVSTLSITDFSKVSDSRVPDAWRKMNFFK